MLTSLVFWLGNWSLRGREPEPRARLQDAFPKFQKRKICPRGRAVRALSHAAFLSRARYEFDELFEAACLGRLVAANDWDKPSNQGCALSTL